VGIEEFLFERLQGLIIQMKLDLECPTCHPLALVQEVNNLIEDGIKVHLGPSYPCGGDAGPKAAHGQTKEEHML
jgi:hypothetical protein